MKLGVQNGNQTESPKEKRCERAKTFPFPPVDEDTVIGFW
jgi:hypothetical protein